MKISTLWLKELFPTLSQSAGEIAAILTDVGLEVESISSPGAAIENIIVARVTEREKHPDADRLSVCRVSDGTQTYQVVCGAPNVTAGKSYPFARIGTIMPAGLEIKKAKIRNVESEGMLCSARELGLSDEAQGLLELSEDAPLGQSFSAYYGLHDVILEVAVTPNRGDCLSHAGILREIAAKTGSTFSLKDAASVKNHSTAQSLQVSVKNPESVRRYMGRVIEGVSVKPSPLWLKRQLENLDVRSINNIVDATNYVMLLTGHPLHAFDASQVLDRQVVVRTATQDEKFKALDGRDYVLSSTDLVIADGKGVLALAGVMGGESSEICDQTTNIILEAASFAPEVVRKTSKTLGLSSESSYRFERDVPQESVADAMARLTHLILDIAGGEAVGDLVDHHSKPRPQRVITLRLDRLKAITGIDISEKEVSLILSSLGMTTQTVSEGIKAAIPPFRNDLLAEVDLIEEVVRFKGFDSIPLVFPGIPLSRKFESPISRAEDDIRNFFTMNGFVETIHYSFQSPQNLKESGCAVYEELKLLNPLSEDLSVLRSSLLPSLLETFQKNHAHKIYEFRPIYTQTRQENRRISGLYSGDFFDANWARASRTMDFFDGKALLENFLKTAQISSFSWKRSKQNSSLHPEKTATLMVGEQELGILGEVHPAILAKKGITQSLYYFDLDADLLATIWRQTGVQAIKPSPFPVVVRDLALVLSEEIEFAAVKSAILDQKASWLKEVQLFDVYRGKPLPEGKKNMAMSLLYESADRTLTDEEVNAVHFDLVKKTEVLLGASLR